MTKSTITRERAQQIFLGNGPEPSASEERELARMALVAMDSEPVAYTDERNLGYIDRGRETAYLWGKQNSEASDVALYRHAQPALVIPNEMTAEQAYEIGYYYGDPVNVFARGANWMRQHIIDSTLAAAPQAAPVVPKEMTAGIAVKHWEGGRGSIESFVAGYNFCRAAMFHASPVCTYPSGDGSLRWPCPVHPGNYPVTQDGWTGNDKANAALMMLDRIETVDPVDDDRIDGIKRIVRELAAAPQEVK